MQTVLDAKAQVRPGYLGSRGLVPGRSASGALSLFPALLSDSPG